MTSAARPTFLPAMGGFSLRDNNTLASKVRNNLDLKSEFTLKFRQIGQNSTQEIKEKDYKKELIDRESSTLLGKRFHELEGDDLVQKRREFLKEISDLDEDDSADSDDSDDSEDETEALMRELQAIKDERKLQELKREEELQAKREQEALEGNPLFSDQGFKIKKRWDDDVIFKNQAVQVEKPKKRFINDLLRSDFHRKFMSKYIK